MDWISDHLKFVVIAVLVIGSILKSHFEAKSKEAAEKEDLPDLGDPDTPDRSYRKMPPQLPSVPPPLPRTTIPAPRPAEAPLVFSANTSLPGAAATAADEAARMLKHQQDLAAHLKQIHDTKATTTGGAVATRARIAAKGKTQVAAGVPLSLRARLKSPAEVRRAFVMNEILGRPVGLR